MLSVAGKYQPKPKSTIVLTMEIYPYHSAVALSWPDGQVCFKSYPSEI